MAGVAAIADLDLYPLAFRRDVPFGTCIGVHLPEADDAEASVLRQRLYPDERPLSATMKGARLKEWIGGRVASRLARTAILGKAGPTLVGAAGAPVAEAGVSVSISHTRRIAVALAGTKAGAAVGVDIEPVEIEAANERLLAERVLSARERQVSPARRDHIGCVQRLSIKEAAYKAVFSLSGRGVSLREMSVDQTTPGDAAFEVSIPVEGIRVDALTFRVEDCFLSLARAGFAGPSG
jgi:4'-phosphopantetheinyl transferase EntD